MVAGSGKQPSSAESQYRQRSRSRAEPAQSPSSNSKTHHGIVAAGTPPPSTNARATPMPAKSDNIKEEAVAVAVKGEIDLPVEI